jgi:hypothetical protein
VARALVATTPRKLAPQALSNNSPQEEEEIPLPAMFRGHLLLRALLGFLERRRLTVLLRQHNRGKGRVLQDP